jgi:hypothetical protein
MYRVIQEKRSVFLGGDSISHCEEESSFEYVYDSEWLLRLSCLNVPTEKHCEW